MSKGQHNGDLRVGVAEARVESGDELNLKKKEDEESVEVVRESHNKDLVAEAKRNVERQALPKQRKDNIMGTEKGQHNGN